MPSEDHIYFDGFEYDQLGFGNSDELRFYLSYVPSPRGKVLELACGTGRLTIPIAQAGHEVTGIDLSDPMLDRARTKAVAAGLSPTFLNADIRNFSVPGQFDLIFLPNNAIGHVHTHVELKSLFSSVRCHLAPNGYFIVETFNPSLEILLRPQEPRKYVAEYHDRLGRRVVVTENHLYDTATQISHVRWYYARNGESGEEIRELPLRIFYPQEFRALLLNNGFEIESVYGDYSKKPFNSTSGKQVAVCRSAPA